MLIRYLYGKEVTVFYQEKSNLVPRVGETIIFDEIDYSRCVKKYEIVVDGNKVYKAYSNEYIIDEIPAILTVIDVCYELGNEEPTVDITVENYFNKHNDNEDYLENLAKDVNIPNDYR